MSERSDPYEPTPAMGLPSIPINVFHCPCCGCQMEVLEVRHRPPVAKPLRPEATGLVPKQLAETTRIQVTRPRIARDSWLR